MRTFLAGEHTHSALLLLDKVAVLIVAICDIYSQTPAKYPLEKHQFASMRLLIIVAYDEEV